MEFRHTPNPPGREAASRRMMAAHPLLSSMEKDPLAVLRGVFGHPAFKAGQEEVVKHVLAGVPTFAVFPTGEGKSLCYQLPAVIKYPALTVVVSPLKALMDDQVAAMRTARIPADTYHSDMSDEERGAVLERVRSGKTAILLISPERLSTREMMDAICSRRVGLLAIDEAHCMSVWGHDFRIAYLNVRNAFGQICRSGKEKPALLFLSATAPAHIRKDVRQLMGIKEEEIAEVILPPLRKNLELCFMQVPYDDSIRDYILAELEANEGKKLVYCRTVTETGDLSSFLNSRGTRAVPYNGPMDGTARTMFLRQFMAGEADVVCCTSAFGMGIDIPDIRLIVHNQLPYTLEDYYQQAGRAGRDGLPAKCVAFYHSYWPTREQIRTPRISTLRSVYSMLYGWHEKSEALKAAHPDMRISDLTFAMATDRLRSICHIGEKGKGRGIRKGPEAKDNRFIEVSMMASLGFLIDNGYVAIEADNRLTLHCHPDKLAINERLVWERGLSARARADAIATFLSLDPDKRHGFLSDYMVKSIDKVMETYPSIFERIETGIVELVREHPSLTSRKYAMVLNGSQSQPSDKEAFGQFHGLFPHIGYSLVEYVIEDLIERGKMEERESGEGKSRHFGLFVKP